MKKILNVLLVLLMLFSINCNAKESSIVLNKAVTDDVAHTFQYPNLTINNDFSPYSLSLSIENGYFTCSDSDLNNAILTNYIFKGGTDSNNGFKDNLDNTTRFKEISFNLKETVDITEETTRGEIIESIKNFLTTIVFHNETDKDAKFTLYFSEVPMKFDDSSAGIDGIDIISYGGHYYAKVSAPEILWSEAYDIAAGLKFNGLQGYLVTITSEGEHNFIYNSLNPGTGNGEKGWMGAAAITNPQSIKFNTKGINWNSEAYTSKEKGNYSPTGTTAYDKQVRESWYWVAGPEAGTRVFDGYTNFNPSEPNNYNKTEWAGQYGQGAGGLWNDYPDYQSDILCYYIEFGGFPNETPNVEPVSLVNTYPWKDYDFRNIEAEIYEKIEVLTDEEKKALTQEEFETMVEEAIEEAGVEDVNFEVDFKKFIVKILIGEEGNETTYNLNVAKKLLRNPQTGDSLLVELIITISTLLTIIQVAIIYRKKYIY